jgi:hypothetical protein
MILGGLRWLAAWCAAAALVACTGGPALPPHASGSAGIDVMRFAGRAPRYGNIVLSIRIPKHARAPRVRVSGGAKPAYISPSTRGMTIAITGPTNLTRTIGLLPTSAGCAGARGGTSCSVTVTGLRPCVPISACYAASISTYDAVTCTPACTIPPSANELSAAQDVSFGVITAQANTVNLTLGGIPASISATPLHPGYLQGDGHGLTLWGPRAQTLVVEARDADGNAIVGAGAPTIGASVKDHDPIVTGPTAAQPNLLTLRSTTSGSPPVVSPGVVNLAIGATPAAGGGSAVFLTVPLTIAHSVVCVGGTSAIEEFYDGNTSRASITISGASTGLNSVLGLGIDRNGTIYAANQLASSIGEFAAGANGNVAPSTTIAGGSTNLSAPQGLGIDDNGSVYVANGDFSGGAINAFTAGSAGNATPAATISGAGTGLAHPAGLVVDGNRNIFVTNQGGNSIVEYVAGAAGDASPGISISGVNTGLSAPAGLAMDTNGTLYVVNAGSASHSLTEYASNEPGNVPPIASITSIGFSGTPPGGVAVDASGAIFAGTAGAQILVFAAGANGSAVPTATISAAFDALSIAVVPASL